MTSIVLAARGRLLCRLNAQYRTDVDSMRLFYVRSSNDTMVPLYTLVKYEKSNTVPSITRFNGASAMKIAGDPAPGYSTGPGNEGPWKK